MIDNICAELETHKAEHITLLDLTNKPHLAEHMIIATGMNQRHLASLAEHLRLALRKQGLRDIIIEEGEAWFLVSVGSLIIHLFTESMRDFYNLEELWGKSPKKP